MQKIKIKNPNGKILKTRYFNTKQDLEEFYEDYQVGNNILINDNWYRIIAKVKNVFYVEVSG